MYVRGADAVSRYDKYVGSVGDSDAYGTDVLPSAHLFEALTSL